MLLLGLPKVDDEYVSILELEKKAKLRWNGNNNIGRIYLLRGQYEIALIHFERSLIILRHESGDENIKGSIVSRIFLGEGYYREGHQQ